MSYSPFIDIPIVIVTYVGLTIGMAFWLKRESNRSVVSLAASTARLGIVLLGLLTIAMLADSPVWMFPGALVVLAAVSGVLSLVHIPVAEICFLAVCSGGFLIVQFVLGFPAFLLKPPVAEVKQDETPEIVGHNGVALSRMNPTGRVDINGKTYSAKSEDSVYIAKGDQVVVKQATTSLLTVAVVEQPTTDT